MNAYGQCAFILPPYNEVVAIPHDTMRPVMAAKVNVLFFVSHEITVRIYRIFFSIKINPNLVSNTMDVGKVILCNIL